MGRPKGSKNKKTKAQTQVQEKPVRKRRTRIKKIVDSSSTEKIKKTLQEARKKKKSWTEEQKASFSHVLILEYPYFIQATSTCYVLKQFVDKKDDKGEYRQPLSMCYASRLADILKISADRLIRVPSNVDECEDNIERIYSMIDARIENKRPCELFEEYKTAQELRNHMLQ
jgi:hypothetical protein